MTLLEVLARSCGMTALVPTGSVGQLASAPRVTGAQGPHVYECALDWEEDNINN